MSGRADVEVVITAAEYNALREAVRDGLSYLTDACPRCAEAARKASA